jgi:hypothetical protein
MRVLKTDYNINFSCGIYQLTGFGNTAEGERLANILADLADCDGFSNRYVYKEPRWDYTTHDYRNVDVEGISPRCAMFMVSLNAKQCKFWRSILLAHDYVEVTKPIRNPNSGNSITVFIRQRKPRSRKKKEVKK